MNKIFLCDLCGRSNYSELFKAPAMHLTLRHVKKIQYYQYVKCSDCDLISQFPQVNDNAIIDLYENTSYHELEGILGVLFDELMPIYYSLTRPIAKGNGKKLLDVGAGSGKFLVYALRKGWEVSGTEFSQEAIKISGVKNNITLIPQDQMGCLPSNTFDAVTIYHVLEHVPSPKKLLNDIFSILVPSGTCIVQIPVVDSLDYFIWRSKSIWIGAPQHRHLFTCETFKRLATLCGFKVDRIANDWLSPHLFTWSCLYEIERRLKICIPMVYKKIIATFLLPAHIPVAGIAAMLNYSPFKTFYLKKMD